MWRRDGDSCLPCCSAAYLGDVMRGLCSVAITPSKSILFVRFSPRLCSVFSSVQRFLETGDLSWRPEYKVSSELQQLLFSFLSHSSSRARSFNWTFFPQSQDSASSCLDTLQHCMQMTYTALLLYPAVHLLIMQFTRSHTAPACSLNVYDLCGLCNECGRFWEPRLAPRYQFTEKS